ncbi:DsbA family oxidoreductase [Altericroceibacterium xinjiangense]|uniref:DsbA family oxidoreductase n=1 Tax=Altericroceibacterium xinjiangense TaxID=762261 RepID=UPI000F7D71AE|nr:DsbA family oxidoreductase [Altericroceibacterium xinjiangense]
MDQDVTQPKTPVVIDIWSDVMCPWCAIGYAQLETALRQLEGEIDANIRWMPFELNPDAPAEGKSQAKHVAEVYGRSLDEVAQMRAQIEESARRVGFSMDYEGEGEPPEPMMWNTFDAHKLLRWGLAQAGPEAQTRLEKALFRAHFSQRRNVSDRGVLLDIAASEGLDRESAAEALDDPALATAVRLEQKRGVDSGIRSVPSFVVNGRYLIQGAREPEAYIAALREVAAA